MVKNIPNWLRYPFRTAKRWILNKYNRWRYPAFYEATERENEKLESAKRKIVMPSILACNSFASLKGLKVELTYTDLNSGQKVTEKLPFEIEDTPSLLGMWFNIKREKTFVVPGVKMSKSYGLDDQLVLEDLKGSKFYIPQDSIDNFETVPLRSPQVLNGRILRMGTTEYRSLKDYYFRLIIKIEDPEVTYPAEILEDENFLKFDNPNWDLQESIFGMRFLSIKGQFCKIDFNNTTFDFYSIEDVKGQIIDGTNRTDIDTFKKLTLAIRTAFALLSGKFYRTQAFYIASKDQNFSTADQIYYEKEQESTITEMQLINPRMFFEYYKDQDEAFKQKYRRFHQSFPIQTFSKLCEEIVNNSIVERTIELILSGNENLNPVQKGAIYSVAVETLANDIYEKNKAKLNPIKDKALSRKLKADLLAILDKYKTDLDEEGYKILANKINMINQPTNRNRLVQPFTLTGVILSEEEVGFLEHRNDFLHGNTANNDILEVERIALGLHHLIGCLLLKKVGYEGHIINLGVAHVIRNKAKSKLYQALDFSTLLTPDAILKLAREGKIDEAKQELKRTEAALKLGMYLKTFIRILEN